VFCSEVARAALDYQKTNVLFRTPSVLIPPFPAFTHTSPQLRARALETEKHRKEENLKFALILVSTILYW
jgi:hypothetical protein